MVLALSFPTEEYCYVIVLNVWLCEIHLFRRNKKYLFGHIITIFLKNYLKNFSNSSTKVKKLILFIYPSSAVPSLYETPCCGPDYLRQLLPSIYMIFLQGQSLKTMNSRLFLGRKVFNRKHTVQEWAIIILYRNEL